MDVSTSICFAMKFAHVLWLMALLSGCASTPPAPPVPDFSVPVSINETVPTELLGAPL